MKLFSVNTIGKKFLVPMLALMIISLGGLGIFMMLNNNASIKSMMNSKGNSVADFMAKISVGYFANFDYLALDDFVKEIAKDPEVEFAVFYDEQNKPLTKSIMEPEDNSSLLIFERKITDADGKPIGRLKLGYKNTALSGNLRKNIIIVCAGVLIALSLLVFGMSVIIRSITAPLKQLLRIFQNISCGEGDLTQRLEVTTHDEIGNLAMCFNRFVEKLHEIISKVAHVTNQVASSAEEVSAYSGQIALGAEQQNAQSDRAAVAMQEMASSVTHIAESADKASSSTKEVNDITVKSGEKVILTVDSMYRTYQSVKEASSIIETLGAGSGKIGEIIKVINDIASQTNLLALNAAIEAARAGEQGRGFSVVADEVRKLAERTTFATGEIGDMIKGIQHDTLKAIESIQSSAKIVEAGVESANQAGESLQQIVTAVSDVTGMVQQIATATEEQSSVGEEISSTIESVATVSRDTAGNAQQSSKASHDLSALASELQHLVSGFKLQNGKHETINDAFTSKATEALFRT
ncbi:MAG: methyl-accepting chemotaxis protein [Nitrospirae bacterium]|nr:methyl-accepting chemotaxis protein [Nitrospirota bacterium]